MYGIDLPDSDIDIRGVFIPILYDILNPLRYNTYKDTVVETEGNYDSVYYSIQKFMKLLADGSPNIIELLFAEDTYHGDRSYIFNKYILGNRDVFINANTINNFISMAINSKKSWRQFAKDSLGHILYVNDKAMVYFDTKNACTTLRVLSEAIELIKYGDITFPSPAQSILLDVRQGKMSEKDCEVEYNDLMATIESISWGKVLCGDSDKMRGIFDTVISEIYHI